MNWCGNDPLLAGAMACAVLAAWLTGALVLLRLIRGAEGGGRRMLRMSLPLPARRAEEAVVASLGSSGHYLLSFTGRMEQALTGEILAPGSVNRRPLALLVLRVEEAGDGASLVQARLDFSGMIERTRGATARVIWAIWPAWIAMVAVATVLLRAGQDNPWLLLHGFHATYPLVAVLVLAARYQRRRRRIGDAVSAAMRAVRHTVQ